MNNSIVLNQFGRNNIIAGFGNPLLDISTNIKDKQLYQSILNKFNLKPDGQKEVDNFEFNNILSTLKSENYEFSYNPGGCAQNTLRIIQALVKLPSFCVLFGGLGSDEEGEILETEVKKSGVETRYSKHSSQPTGKVIALVNGEDRSLVAHLGAADYYSAEDFKTFENLRVIEEVYAVYIEGFFITHSFDVCVDTTMLSQINGVAVVFNISGVYVAENNSKELLQLASAADVLIGNADEFKALGKVMGLNCSNVENLALKVHSSLWADKCLPTFKLKQMNRLGKSLIITQNKSPVLCVCSESGSVVKFDVPFLDPKLVKDPTGAGDAFAAGFMVAFLEDKSIVDCLAYGCEIAQQVIQHVGVQLAHINTGKTQNK